MFLHFLLLVLLRVVNFLFESYPNAYRFIANGLFFSELPCLPTKNLWISVLISVSDFLSPLLNCCTKPVNSSKIIW